MKYTKQNRDTVLDLHKKGYAKDKICFELKNKFGIKRDHGRAIVKEIIGSTVKHDTEFTAKVNAELENIIETRQSEITRAAEKLRMKQLVEDAEKWRKFQVNSYAPIQALIDQWSPEGYTPIKYIGKPSATKVNRAFCAGAFDFHFGALAEARYLHKGKDWNLKVARECVDKYAKNIAERVKNDVVGFDTGVLLLGGDLYNSLTGYTSNMTPLLNEVGKDTQFEAIMNALIFLISSMLEIFPKVECHFVRGNHGGTTDIPLAWAIKNWFRTEARLNFEISSCRTKHIRIGNTLILLDHGASDQSKAQVPMATKPREAYILKQFMAHPELLVGVKQKIFVMGDLHHFEHYEYAEFEFIMMGSFVLGDQYSDSKNLHNRPRQNCIVLNNDGIEAVHQIFFD